MSDKRSNRRKGRSPLSAYAKLRKQHNDRQYRLDIAVFGHSRLFDRMRETGRLDEDGCLTRNRNAAGQFTTGFRSSQQTTQEELNLFLDDLVGTPTSVTMCPCCSQVLRKCTCWENCPRYDFRGETSQAESASVELADLRLPLSYSQKCEDDEENRS